MPYTSEELRGVDFYAEFLDKKERAYLERLTKSAYQGFTKDNGTLVSFQALEDSSLGFEDANLNSAGVYSTFVSALSDAGGHRLLNILNEEYNAYMESLTDTPGASAESIGQAYQSGQTPTLYQTSDVPTYIRELAQGKAYNVKLPKNVKTSTLEAVVDRQISELSEDKFADSLPENVLNGDVVQLDDSDDYRRWLIDNNQKHIFPNEDLFYGLGYDYTQLKTVTDEELNTIPDGEPVE
tara:strand:- start:603 stop:1319 length:717 start_codon:yes stop_codon:yes gene_type:complete